MSFLLRQLCATLVLVVLIRCSQLPDEEWSNINTEKRSPSATHLRIGKRTSQEILPDASPNLSNEDEMQNVEKRDRTFLRIGRTPSEPTFLRFGRSPSQTFLRIGRAGPVKTFLRIGRSGFLRIGRGLERKYIRLGRSILHAGENEQGRELTPEQIQFLMENKERLLQLLQPNQNQQASSEFEDDGSYFAFPRQGRAMNVICTIWFICRSSVSFYFPRMGRSGDNNLEDSMLCCSGVRSILTTEKAIDICSPDQACCSGLSQKTKLYKNVVITECSEDSLDKIRAYIGED